MLHTAIDLEDYWDRVVADPNKFPSFSIGARFGQVERVFRLTEEALPHFQTSAIAEAHIDLAKYVSIYEASDVEYWRDNLNAELNATIPAAFNSAAIFVLASAREQSFRDLANYCRRINPSGCGVSGAGRQQGPYRDFCRQLGLKEIGDESIQTDLQDLSLVRNALAHAGGYIFEESDARREELMNLVSRNKGVLIAKEQLITDSNFLKISLSAVVVQLNLAMAAVASSFPL